MNVGDLIKYRTSRNQITRDLVYDLGLVLEVQHEPGDHDGDLCKVLTSRGKVTWIRAHGTSVLNEGW